MGELRPIGEVLRGLTVTAEDGTEVAIAPLAVPDLGMLLDPRVVPARAVLDKALAEARVALGARRDDATGLEAHERRLLRLLSWCDMRDRIAATRPPGCWCLGRGYRALLPHEAPITYLESCVEVEGTSYPVVESGRAVRYCDCADGERVEAEHAAARALEEARRRGERTRALWRESGLPDDPVAFSGRSWLEEVRRRDPGYVRAGKAILEHLARWQETDDWLWLDGPWGRGKTVLMQIMAGRLAQDGASVLFRTAPVLLDDIRMSFDEQGGRTAALIRSLSEVDVLAVDDVGKEKPTEWVRERFYVLVNERYARRKRTLFTSNLALDDPRLAERMDESVAQRIVHRCGETGIVRLVGPNLRVEVS